MKAMKPEKSSKTLIAVIAIAASLFGAANLDAQDLSLSVSTWSFFAGKGGYRPADEGTYAELGATLGLSPRIEADLGLICSLTPAPANTLFVNAGVTYSIIGKRFISYDEPTGLFTMLFTVGVMEGFHDIWESGDPFSTSTHIYLKLTPFAVGSLYYGKRDRCFSLGIQYDLKSSEFSLFTNIIASDFLLTNLGNSR
ncbi:MAG: hypothetical protein LLF89_01025 [Spirochaetaceae bacterium]|nr:hypothetical protein [Spirochaetaceae bacterium]